jgi:hypothetical protein
LLILVYSTHSLFFGKKWKDIYPALPQEKEKYRRGQRALKIASMAEANTNPIQPHTHDIKCSKADFILAPL